MQASFWAGYVFRDDRGPFKGLPCAYIGAFQEVGRNFFFHESSGCKALWPGPDADEPLLVGAHISGTYKGRNHGESYGLLLLAPTVDLVRLDLKSGLHRTVAMHRLPRRVRTKLSLPAMHFGTYSVTRNACVERVRAFDREGKLIGTAASTRCHD